MSLSEAFLWPLSRWFNKRVNNFLQKQADEAEARESLDDGGEIPDDMLNGNDVSSSDDEDFFR